MTDITKEQYQKLSKKREQQIEEVVEWLEDRDNVKFDSLRRGTVDFTIGDILDDWPDHFDDDHLNAIHRSSVEIASSSREQLKQELFVTSMAMHLPPTHERYKSDIRDKLDLDEQLAVHFGSRALGGMPAPDGVITPHVHVLDATTVESAHDAMKAAVDIFEDVYDEGSEVIKEQP